MTAKVIGKEIPGKIASECIEKLKELSPDLSDQETVLQEVEKYLFIAISSYMKSSFWYDEASALFVRAIDYFEENLGVDLQSAVYEGIADQWLKFFEQLVRPYCENPL